MQERGCSLTEILVALLLITSISLALLKQQWQVNRLRRQVQSQHLLWLQESNQYEQGATLMDCLMGLALALLLMTWVMQQYLIIKHQSDLAVQAMTKTSRLHTALESLRRRGHQAGFTPCMPLQHLISFDASTHKALQTLVIEEKPFFKLTFHRMSDDFVSIEPRGANHTFALIGANRLNTSHAMLISDCQHAEVLDVYPMNPHTIRFMQTPHFTYDTPIYLGEWLTESFWVAPDKHAQSVLFYMQQQHAEALLSGVQGIQASLSTHKHRHLLEMSLDLGEISPIPLTIWMYHL